MKKKIIYIIKEWVISIIIAVCFALLIRTFVVALYIVDGSSMKPTLLDGERLVVNKFLYRFKEPQKGDIIVFEYPSDREKDFVKRVIATPGDDIEIINGIVFLKGQPIKEKYIFEPMILAKDYPKIHIPPGYIFVMGDNRNNSEDSRFRDVGLVSFENIKGKAMLLFWPLNKFKVLP